MQFYAAAGVVDRGAGPANYRSARLDAVSGALFACIISITIIIATGATIGGAGRSLGQGGRRSAPAGGRQRAELLFAFGLLGASALAGAVVPLSSSYAISEAIGVDARCPAVRRSAAVPRPVHVPGRLGAAVS